jgi:hypothetical protein
MRRAAWAMVLLTVSCGLMPQDDLTGRRIGDGVAPWEDLGPVTLCLGTHRIGPPASAIGGFCQAIDTPPETACETDSGCASRERCVCGRCTVQYCTGQSECGPDLVCIDHRCNIPCAGDGACGRGETCVNGGCRGGCRSGSDCQAGEVCSTLQGRCITDECADDTGCPGTDFCAVQREPRDVAEPTVLATSSSPGGDFTMWLEMSDQNPLDRAIWRAESKDGLTYRFNPATPVLENAGDAHAPSAIEDQRGCLLYYERADGIWETPCPASAGSEAGRLVLTGDYHAPSGVAGDDRIFVTVGARAAIAAYRVPPTGGPAGTPQIAYQPADATDPVYWRNVQQVGSPFVLRDGDLLMVWFDAFGTETRDVVKFGVPTPVPANDSIGFASGDANDPLILTTWPYNPIFDRPILFENHQAERAPAVVRIPGGEAREGGAKAEQWLLYYEGLSADGATRHGIGVARNPPAL